MTLQLLALFLGIASTALFGQDESIGVFGKITSRPKSGDLAPEISFTEVLHNAASEPWVPANFYGRVTVLAFLPYISGNPDLVDKWNALVERFAGTPVQFALFAGEKESTLLPFLQEHPMKGWVFHDPQGGTGRSYGLESIGSAIIGTDHTIVGFDHGILPGEEVVTAVLEDRITIAPPKPTFENLRDLSESGRVVLFPEPERMPRSDDYRPDFSPSYAVHIAPTQDSLNLGNYAAPDYWSLRGYTVKKLLAEILDVNPIRIDLPASVDTDARYDFSVVLPKPEDRGSMRSLIQQGAEDYFHLVPARENRSREVYVLTAANAKLRAATSDRFTSDGFISSIDNGGPDGLPVERPHDIEAVTGISLQDSTVDQFCKMLEWDLDRPVVNETKIEGTFDFEVRDPNLRSQTIPKRDFVERLRDQLGLVIAPSQRNVETIVYRLR